MEALPKFGPNSLFETEFTPYVNLPGFFPGAGGFFHGYKNHQKRFLFFGTDFGPLSYQRTLPNTRGEPESVATIRNLRNVIEQEAGLPLSNCFLTNAVLCLRRGESATSAFPIWQRFSDYVNSCASWHRRFIAEHKPEAVVLMGLPHLTHFGRLLFPELISHWAGLKTMKGAYEAGKETFRLPDGTKILLMHHPSFWHAHPPSFKAKAIEHLRALSKTEVQLPRLSAQASKLWHAIPPDARRQILANVFCAHCRGSVSMANEVGTVKGGDIVLNGSCAVCGHDVARLVEGSSI